MAWPCYELQLWSAINGGVDRSEDSYLVEGINALSDPGANPADGKTLPQP
jgi:hypothetical protein